MKINEFGNKQQVEEGLGDGLQSIGNAVIGKNATSAIKGMFTGNQEQGVEDAFVRNFLTSVTPRLKQAISTGLVSLPAASAAPDLTNRTADGAPPTPEPAAAPNTTSSNSRKDAAGNVPYDDLAETAYSKYAKLNAIFESIMSEEEVVGGSESISQFLEDWFTKYMQGYNWQSRKPVFDAIFKEVESTYSKTGGKEALKKLAKAAFAITGGATPSKINATPNDTTKSNTIQNQQPTQNNQGVGQGRGQGAGQSVGGQAPMSASFVQAHLDALKQSDPKGYAAIVSKIIKEYKKTFAARNSKKAAAPTPPPVPAAAPAAGPVTKTEPPVKIAESRLRRYPKL
jgi:hypothetical protein